MASHAIKQGTELTALLICPNRALAQQFTATLSDSRTFNILADVKSYPTPQALDMRVRQLRPDLILLDLSSNLETALGLMPYITSFRPTVHIIGLHSSSDADVIMRSLRAGATEFLCAPFDTPTQNTVVARVLRLRENEERTQPARGKLIAFVGAKAGYGASTLAYNTAYALRKDGRRKILLADFDLLGGTLSFALKLNHSYSLLDGIRHSDQLDTSLWSALIANAGGLDVMPAPEKPETMSFEGHRIHEILEYARVIYEAVVIDLPAAYERISMATLGDADEIFIVCTPELPSLHMTRKCIVFLDQMGFNRDRFRVVVNRSSRKDELSCQDMVRVFNFPVHYVFPDDYATMHRALTAGKPVPPNCELGKHIRRFSENLLASEKPEEKKKKSLSVLNLAALLPES
jgi:pilus assembly protein CpaE